MKIVIDIPDKVWDIAKEYGHLDICGIELSERVMNGTPYEERPNGEWVINEEWSLLEKCKVTTYTCPFCGRVEYEPFDYCRCGADMRKGKEDEDSN